MKKPKIQDIQHGHVLPDNFKVLLARSKQGIPENLYVEIYRARVAMYKNVRLRCNLQSYHAAQNNLSQLLLKAKYEAKALWPHVKARELKIGQVYIDHRREKCPYKRLPLTNSWFSFNPAENELVLYLWGRRFELELTSQEKYVGSRFINYRTGRPEMGISLVDEPFAEALIDKINEQNDGSVFEAAVMFADGFDSEHSISIDAFMDLLAMYWDYPIEIDGHEYVFRTMKDEMR